MDVALSFYKPEHADGLNGFVLSEEDKKFTALPKDVLPQALVIRDRYPTVILKEDRPVGFFILHTSKETIAPYSNNVSAILLSALSLHAPYQEKVMPNKRCCSSPLLSQITFLGVMKSCLL